jgi:hypothetical protein
MRPTERTAGGDPPPGRWDGSGEMTDRELLDLGVEMLVAQNRAHAARLQAVSDFHARRVAESEVGEGVDDGEGAGGGEGGGQREGGQPRFFRLTPLQATKA